jgi:hypothetical protein
MKPQSHDISQPPRSNWWFVCLVLGVAFTAIGLWVWPSIQNGSDDWGYSIRDADWTNAERASLKLRLGQEQSALARYEAEHREWSTETIAKMKKLVDEMQEDATEVAKKDGAEAVDAFIAERKLELEVLTEEMNERLAAIEKKAEEVEALKRQLGEIEEKMGIRPTAME